MSGIIEKHKRLAAFYKYYRHPLKYYHRLIPDNKLLLTKIIGHIEDDFIIVLVAKIAQSQKLSPSKLAKFFVKNQIQVEELLKALFNLSEFTTNEKTYLGYLSFLDDFPETLENLYTYCTNSLPTSYDSLKTFKEDLELLFSKGWILPHPNGILLHSKIKKMLQEQLLIPLKHREIFFSGVLLAISKSSKDTKIEDLNCFKQAINISQLMIEGSETLSFLNTNLGILIEEETTDYAKAKLYYQRAVSICEDLYKEESLINKNYLIEGYLNLAEILFLINDDEKGIIYFKKSLEICQKESPENYSLLIRINIKLGEEYTKLKEYDASNECYKNALKYFAVSPNPNYILWRNCYDLLASNYISKKDILSAIDYFLIGISIVKKHLSHDIDLLIKQYITIAKAFSKVENFAEAINYQKKAILLREEQIPNNKKELMKLYSKMIIYCVGNSEMELSRTYLLKSLNLPETAPLTVSKYSYDPSTFTQASKKLKNKDN